MIGDTFKNLKNKYTEIQISESEVDKKWQITAAILPEQEIPRNSYHFIRYGGAFVSALFIVLALTIGFAQAAKPGSFLYPVHTVTQEVAKGVISVFQPNENHVNPPKIHVPLTPSKLSIPTTKPTSTPVPQSIKNEEKHEGTQNENKNNIPGTKVLGTHTENGAFHETRTTTNPQTNHNSSQRQSEAHSEGNNHNSNIYENFENSHNSNNKNEKNGK